MKNIKLMGLACIAMLALAAMLGAAVASASQFRSEAYPVAFKGKGGTAESEALYFKGNGGIKGGSFRCEAGSLTASASAASSAVSLVPSYGGCTISGVGATFKPNGCSFVLHSTNESAPYKGTMDIACAKEGEALEASNAGCKLTIPAQSGLGGVSFTNSGKGRARTIVSIANLTGLKYTFAKGCAEKVVGTFEGGTLESGTTISGTNEKGTYGLGVYIANEQIEEPPLFKAEKYLATVQGVAASAKFGLKFASFFCGTSSLWAGLPAASSKMSGAPLFTGCSTGGTSFAVENNGCEFSLGLSGGGPPNSAGMGLSCPGKPLTLTSALCTIKIGSQEWPGSVEFTNTGTGKSRGVKWHTAITTMKYEQSSCFGGNGSFSNGQLEADWQLSGANAEGEDGLWIE